MLQSLTKGKKSGGLNVQVQYLQLLQLLKVPGVPVYLSACIDIEAQLDLSGMPDARHGSEPFWRGAKDGHMQACLLSLLSRPSKASKASQALGMGSHREGPSAAS